MFATPVLVAGGSEAGICVQIHCAAFIGQVRKPRVSDLPITKQQRDGFSEFGYKVVRTVLFSPRGHTREGRGGDGGRALPVPAAAPPCVKHSAGGAARSNPLFVSSVLTATLIGKYSYH